jgi:hypothetical protein
VEFVDHQGLERVTEWLLECNVNSDQNEKHVFARTLRYVIQRNAQTIFPMGIAKPVYRIKIRTKNPATGTAVAAPVEKAAIVLQ